MVPQRSEAEPRLRVPLTDGVRWPPTETAPVVVSVPALIAPLVLYDPAVDVPVTMSVAVVTMPVVVKPPAVVVPVTVSAPVSASVMTSVPAPSPRSFHVQRGAPVLTPDHRSASM